MEVEKRVKRVKKAKKVKKKKAKDEEKAEVLDVKKNNKLGKDRLVIIRGNRKPVEEIITERLAEEDMEKGYGDARVWCRSKSLQRLPSYMRGCIIWVPYLEIIAIVLGARGERGYVKQIYPKPKAGCEKFKMNMLQHGYYLEQIHGELLEDLSDHSGKKQLKEIMVKGELKEVVVPIIDHEGYVMLNKEGPDVADLSEEDVVPSDVEKWMLEDVLSTNNNYCLRELRKYGKKKEIEVVYVLKEDMAAMKKPCAVNGIGLLAVPTGDCIWSERKR